MSITYSTFRSLLHDSEEFHHFVDDFLSSIEKKTGKSLRLVSLDDYQCDLKLLFIQTGGTEGLFLKEFSRLKEPFYLLTNGKNNSLAASMEIITYLRNHGLKGEIIHGDEDYVAGRILQLKKAEKTKKALSKCRLGVFGTPSDWLISSLPNYQEIKKMFGITLYDVPLAEVTKAYQSETVYPQIHDFDSCTFSKEELDCALRVSSVFESLNAKYSLSGFTIRCFDLLDSLHTTGCLGLSLLNKKGMIGSCEGDIMAMISMLLVRVLFNQSSFQANPSLISLADRQVIFAHCTLPLDMTRSYALDTHFESGIGAAVKGELKEGDVTVFRLSADLKRAFIQEGKIIRNLNLPSLCRTQILVEMDGLESLLKDPCGNHHIIFYGHHKKELADFLSTLNENYRNL